MSRVWNGLSPLLQIIFNFSSSPRGQQIEREEGKKESVEKTLVISAVVHESDCGDDSFSQSVLSNCEGSLEIAQCNCEHLKRGYLL